MKRKKENKTKAATEDYKRGYDIPRASRNKMVPTPSLKFASNENPIINQEI